MNKSIDFDEYLDKVKGCFLGKTVIGTLGAPFEGVKMPMDLKFKPEMVNTMLPNDDLDLQVLWLEVVEKYGLDFTSSDLLKAFCENCDYSPGEYAIMRKNYEKRIMPPYSGKFNNDFYISGMGCPIRSEIWACLAPNKPKLAASLSEKDGVLDHAGKSVDAEKYFAACEAIAFRENDLNVILREGLKVLPDSSEFKKYVPWVLELCEKYDNIKEVETEILYSYGHLDCTNMMQNMGITIASLIFGEYDMIKTGMIALNCGFDTDCTCASAGALLGIILGSKKLEEIYGWKGIKYVLGVRANRRSDLVDDLSLDIATLYKKIKDGTFIPEKRNPIEFRVDYEKEPYVSIHDDCNVILSFINNENSKKVISVSYEFPKNIKTREKLPERILLEGKSGVSINANLYVIDTDDVLYEKNIVKVKVVGDEEENFEFGVSGARTFRVFGPIWKTAPAVDTESLEKVPSYWHLLPPSKTEAESIDNVRKFHLNFDSDLDSEFLSFDELFEKLPEGKNMDSKGTGNFVRPYMVMDKALPYDGFNISDFFGFKGPCVVYMSCILVSEKDETVCAQLGYSNPFKFYVNNELIGERRDSVYWDAENAHFNNITLKKGENRIVLRLTRCNSDDKFSLFFSEGLSCSTHFACFGTKKI